MKRTTTKKAKSPELNQTNLIIASLLFVAWSFVVETFVPIAWLDAAAAFWGFMSAFSPFIVAAVLAYVFLFGIFKPQYLRVGLSLGVAIAMFIFGLALGPISALLPPPIGSSMVWGNLFISVYFGAVFALVSVLAAKVLRSR